MVTSVEALRTVEVLPVRGGRRPWPEESKALLVADGAPFAGVARRLASACNRNAEPKNSRTRPVREVADDFNQAHESLKRRGTESFSPLGRATREERRAA